MLKVQENQDDYEDTQDGNVERTPRSELSSYLVGLLLLTSSFSVNKCECGM